MCVSLLSISLLSTLTEANYSQDPYFDYTTDSRGRKKKVKKQVPNYIPEHDALILAKMRKRSYALDCSLFSLFGTRFGWSSVIGIVPAAGDGLDAALALALVWRCSEIECKLGSKALFLMLLNVVFDFVIGIVPFVGDLLDAGFKANTRNVRILEERLDEVYKPQEVKTREKETRQRGESPPPPATVYEDFSDDEQDRRHVMEDPSLDPRRPDPARTRASERYERQERRPSERRDERRPSERDTRGSGGRGWFGGSKRDRHPDVEMGQVPRR